MGGLGNKEIMAKNIKYYMGLNNINQTDICNTLQLKMSTFSDWVNAKTYPRIDKIELMSNYFGINKSDLVEDKSQSSQLSSNSVRIVVLGSVPAGIPIEAIQDVIDWEEIPAEWTKGGQEYAALKVTGDSMSPKYLEGDVVILRLQDDCESGQDCVVYVNSSDATLKKVIKKTDCIILQPLNSNYEPKIYDYNDEENPVKIFGVVVELRRKI